MIFKTKYEKHSKTIDHIVRTLKNSDISPYIVDVLLYGSCARHQEKYGSDVDVLIIISDDAPTDYAFKKELLYLKADLYPENEMDPAEVDSKFIPLNTWLNSSMLYYRIIRREGVSLWNQKETISTLPKMITNT